MHTSGVLANPPDRRIWEDLIGALYRRGRSVVNRLIGSQSRYSPATVLPENLAQELHGNSVQTKPVSVTSTARVLRTIFSSDEPNRIRKESSFSISDLTSTLMHENEKHEEKKETGIAIDNSTPADSSGIPTTLQLVETTITGHTLFEIQEAGISDMLRKNYFREKAKKDKEKDLSGFYGILIVENGQYFIQEKNKQGAVVITPVPEEGEHQYSFVTVPIKDAQGDIIDSEIRVRKMKMTGDSRHLWMTNYELSVLYVGEILFKNGKIKVWNNQSGAYLPSFDCAKQAGLPMDVFMKHTPDTVSEVKVNQNNSVSKSHRENFQDVTSSVSQLSPSCY